ncbi:MAG: signal peptide peptidase SppA [Bacteroidota bacterium]
MKQFLKTILASMLGVFLSTILLFFFFILLIVGLASTIDSPKTGSAEKGTILHLNLTEEISERASDNPFANLNPMSLEVGKGLGLDRILECLEKASRDPNVSGIYLEVPSVSGGMASMEEIRNGLNAFKKAGKFIYAYADVYSQGGYYLASTADQVWMNPEGMLDMRGMSASIPFFKGTLEKLEVKPEIIRHGKFKSAVEPFILDKMSDENRAQTAEYVDDLWSHYLVKVGESRKIPADSLKSYAANFRVRSATDAVEMGLVDTLAYMDVFLKQLCEKTGKSDEEDLELVGLSKYYDFADPGPEKEPTRDKIAVIYAVGDIVSGKGNESEIGSESLSKTIREVRNDDKVKAVVLRVNSPGGDALASDIIWREMELCRKSKPVIVSMGDVAASGGYYISCNADSIFAQPNTITGSIGVFGLMFNIQDMLKNKLGVTYDSYNTGSYADLGSMTRPMTDSERSIMQSFVEQTYATFTGRVSAGRSMSVAQVDSIGQGRVWSGIDARRLGLVDALGGINEAILAAAKKAGLKNYRVADYPKQKDPIKALLDDISGESAVKAFEKRFETGAQYLQTIESVKKMRGIQARFIFDRISY